MGMGKLRPAAHLTLCRAKSLGSHPRRPSGMMSGKIASEDRIIVDITMVIIAVLSGYMYFGRWEWQVVGIGTLIAMIFVGAAVRIIDPHLEWFSRLLYYRPGIRRYVYGLARYLFRNKN